MTKRLLWVWVFLATFFLVSCDHESRVNVLITAPQETPSVRVDVPPATVNVELPVTNLIGPPADQDVPFNAAKSELPTCEKPGRGIGRGRGHCG
jgi:hypothetical protein